MRYSVLISIIAAMLSSTSPADAMTIAVSKTDKGAVQVKGVGAAPPALLTWQGHSGAQVTSKDGFRFATSLLRPRAFSRGPELSGPADRDLRLARRATDSADAECDEECQRLACISVCQQALGDAQTKCRGESGSDRASRCLASVERDNEECSDKCEGTTSRPCLGDCRRQYEQAVTLCRSGSRELSPCINGALVELQSCTAECSSEPTKKRR